MLPFVRGYLPGTPPENTPDIVSNPSYKRPPMSPQHLWPLTLSDMKKLFLLILLHPFWLGAQEDMATEPVTTFTWLQLSNTAADLYNKGKFKEALSYADAALEVARRDSGETTYCYLDCLHNVGVMLQHSGRLSEALPYLENSVAIVLKYQGPDSQDYVAFMSDLGMLYREFGDLSKALATLQKAVDQLDKTEVTDAYKAIVLNNLALTSEESGMFEQAKRYCKESMELVARTEGKDSPRYATRLTNLAALNTRTNHPEEALTLHQQAHAIYLAKLGPKHSLTLLSDSNIALALENLSRPQEARAKYLEILPVIESEYGQTHRQYLVAATGLARNYIKLQEPQKALDLLLPVFQIIDSLYPGRIQHLRNSASCIALSYEQLGRERDMANWLLRSFGFLQKEIHQQLIQLSEAEQLASFTANILSDYNQKIAFVARHQNNADLCGAGMDIQLALKGLILDNMKHLRQALRENKDTTVQSMLLELKILNKTIAQQYALAPDKRLPAFDSLLQRAVLIEGVLAQQFAEFREATRSVNWRDVQARLKSGESLIDFVHYRETNGQIFYMAWLLRPGDIAPKMIPLFEGKKLGSLKAIRDLYRPGGKLQTMLWEPVEKELNAQADAGKEKIHTLYFSFSGALHQINFGAIPVSQDGGTTLADRFNLHLMGSARQLLEPEEVPSSGQIENALVIGGVQYDADSASLGIANRMASIERSFNFRQYAPSDSVSDRGYFGGEWEYLPWTLREAEAVSGALQKTGMRAHLLKGADASEGAFKKTAESVSLIHIATHGYFFPEADSNAINGFQAAADPLIRSGLLLAGANRVWTGKDPLQGQEDGVLTAYEIVQMDLRKVDLVVLSACETGRGDLTNVEGVYGLQRAFKMAGARYLLMSLWQVDDKVTQEFMDAFYTNWLQRKMTVPEAYRQAQHDLRARYAQPFSPLLWAGFILLE